MSGSGPKTTTTTDPYKLAEPALETGMTDALNLYKKKQLNPYTPMSAQTNAGLSGLVKQAQQNMSPLRNALSQFQGFAGGAGDVSSSGQLDIAKRALGPSLSEQNLSGIAKGDLIGQGDPNYERLRARALENASTEAGMQASGIGRTGSDYHQTAVARQVGDTAAGMDYQRMQDERARQVEANSLIDQQRQAGYGMGLNAQNSATAIQTGNQDRRMSASGAIPGMVDATYGPLQQILTAGRAYDVDKAAKAGAPGSNLSSLMQILGIASPYGTSTTEEPSNKVGQIAGGGLGLLSLLMG